jgi:hypothetical protein
MATSNGCQLGVSVLHDDWSSDGVLAQLATDGCPMGHGEVVIQGWSDNSFKVILESGREIHFELVRGDGATSEEDFHHSPRQWICCGVNLIEMCRRACADLPEQCFFCGSPRVETKTKPHPEDPLALELKTTDT